MPNDDSNKENIPPSKGEEKNNNNNKKKKKNPIPPIAPSFKKKSNRKTKRVPLADITNLFRMNSAPLTTTAHEENGVPATSPSDSVMLHSNSRRRTVIVVPGSKTLRMGFR